jgi:hypothetical protein
MTVTAGKPPVLKPNETVCLSSPTLQLDAGTTDNNLSYLWTPTNSTGSIISVTQPGTYQVRVTSPIGCEATRTITVSAAPQLELGSDKTICEGESVDLVPTITGSGTFTYRWSTGETANTIMYPQFRTVFQLDGSIAKFGIMNKHSKRKFTPEFKFKVALEALQEKQTLAEIAGNGAARAV